MRKIEILGVGCPNCKKAEEEVRKALTTVGLVEGQDFVIEKVTKPADIVARGVMMTPGVVVDGKVVSTGKVPKPGDVISWMG
ncbi:MAG: thioredoxin family protein [Candidatus Zixiibacteriota bacterium]|nr:MAG: thioredoxin family protein [candidate division Zixibacteria bacterium]